MGTKKPQARHISTTIGKRTGLLAGASMREKGESQIPFCPPEKRDVRTTHNRNANSTFLVPTHRGGGKGLVPRGGGGGHGRGLGRRLTSIASGAIQHSPISHSVGPDHRLAMGGWGSLSTWWTQSHFGVHKSLTLWQMIRVKQVPM